MNLRALPALKVAARAMLYKFQGLQSQLIYPCVQIDKEGANIERVRNELSEQGLVWDQWGGDTSMLPVSVKGNYDMELLLCCVLPFVDAEGASHLWLLSCTRHVSAQCFTLEVAGKLDRPGSITSLPSDALAAGRLDLSIHSCLPCRTCWGMPALPPLQISAKKGTGVDELLETLALTAEVEDLQANPERAAAGTVIEAHLDKRMGAVTTLLVQTGTLRVGDVIQTGSCYGKVMYGATVLGLQ